MTRFFRYCAGIGCRFVLGVLMAVLLQRQLATAAGPGVASTGVAGNTFVVNLTADGVDANTDDGVCDIDLNTSGAQCTLRAAIQQANAHKGPDTVVLSGNLTYTLSITGTSEEDGATGDLDVLDDLNITVSDTVTGTGGLAVIDAQQIDRVLHVVQGHTEITGVAFYNGHVADAGGGVLNDGTLIMVNTRVYSNSANDGGGILSAGTLTMTNSWVLSNSAVSGGGLYNYQGQLSLKDTVIQSNTADYLGGGLLNGPGSVMGMNGGDILSNSIPSLEGYGAGMANANIADLYQVIIQGNHFTGTPTAGGAGIINFNGGTLSLELSRLDGNLIPETPNRVSGTGGGLYNAASSHVYVISSTIVRNLGIVGGGIQNDGLITVTASSIYSNHATLVGGGVVNIGVDEPLAHLMMVNSTVWGNDSRGDAGGILNDGDMTLHFVTVAHNVADADQDGAGNGGGIGTTPRVSGSVASNVYNSVIALNIDASPISVKNVRMPDCAGELRMQAFGLLQNPQGCQITGTLNAAMLGVDPVLGPLQDNGGNSWSAKPLFGSPLIDAGDLHSCVGVAGGILPIDQRGNPRPLGDRCDLGAVETVNLITSKLYLPVLQD